MIDLLRTVILGVVEGITEFLPVSSTGHMIICEKWMNIDLDEPFWKLFTVFIQIGAIFAVLVYFRGRIMTLLRGRPAEAVALTPLEASMSVKSEASGTAAHDAAVPLDYETPPVSRSPYWAIWMIIIATVPVLVVGLLTHKWIEAHLGSWMVVALSLGLGGIAMIVIELLPLPVTTEHIESMSLKQALGIGIAQILAAIFPGTSRSAATIMGGLVAGLSRQAATEFSFFLAIPAMFAACGYDLLKHRKDLMGHADRLLLLVIGTLVSFLVAWVVIAAFMAYIRRHNFIPFAVYRIILAAVVILAFHGT